jgi:hypothetical protein
MAAKRFDLVAADFEAPTGHQPTSIEALLSANRDDPLQTL